MTLHNKFTILPTATFKEEFYNIFHHIKYKLYEPVLADRVYKNILEKISTLDFMPEKYVRILYPNSKNRNLRKFTIDNYVVIYEVFRNTRTNIYSTYFS